MCAFLTWHRLHRLRIFHTNHSFLFQLSFPFKRHGLMTSSKRNIGLFDRLPHEILLAILSLLDPSTLCLFSATCRQLRVTATSDALWRPFVQHASQKLSLGHFSGAESFYQVYRLFFRPYQHLLGWWAGGSVPDGIVLRIALDPRCNPAIVCHVVQPTNRLQGLGPTDQAWQDLTSFPAPDARDVVGNGTMLRVGHDLFWTDICEIAFRYTPVWQVRWQDALERPENPFTNSASNSQDVSVHLQRTTPYASQEVPRRPSRLPIEYLFQAFMDFPSPSLLPAVRSLDRSEPAPIARWASEGNQLALDSLVIKPPPNDGNLGRQFLQSQMTDASSRFVPIVSPPSTSILSPPIKHTDQDGTLTWTHSPLTPQQDPAHVDFDWSLIEGLYSMTYGPHGIEMLYVRSRLITESDMAGDPVWPTEPLLTSSDMYDLGIIDRDAAVGVGRRIIEGVKLTGDPNVPRGQVSWRAFVDDPSRRARPWSPPLDGCRNHTPWPLDSSAPGLIIPAHGRVAGEGFVQPGWTPAQVCILSVDEIRVLWFGMAKCSVAKRIFDTPSDPDASTNTHTATL